MVKGTFLISDNHIAKGIKMFTISQSLIAANAGIIIFFSAIIAPVVFKTLPPEFASKYLRAFFPRLYVTLFVTTILAAIFADDASVGALLGVTGFLFLLSRWPLTPAINKATDSNQKGRFKLLHSLSVLILLVQLATFIFLLASG